MSEWVDTGMGKTDETTYGMSESCLKRVRWISIILQARLEGYRLTESEIAEDTHFEIRSKGESENAVKAKKQRPK